MKPAVVDWNQRYSMTSEILIQVGKYKNKCAYIHVLINMYFLALYTERV